MTGNLHITTVADDTDTPTAPTDSQGGMIKARADLIRTYTSIVGGSAVQNDILDDLKLAGGGTPNAGLTCFNLR